MMMTERLFSLAAAQENMASPLFNGGNEITVLLGGVISALTAEEKWSVASLCRIPSPFLRCDTRGHYSSVIDGKIARSS